MSFRSTIYRLPRQIFSNDLSTGIPTIICRTLSLSALRRCEDKPEKEERRDFKSEGQRGYQVKHIDATQSIAYLCSTAYSNAYGDEPVWKPYRRNFKGHYIPEPRKTCIRSGEISTGSACPVCRDDYLVLDYRNVALLKQFVSEITNEALDPKQTGLCVRQYKKLKLELAKAQDCGFMEKHFPFRQYNYSYYKQLTNKDPASQLENAE